MRVYVTYNARARHKLRVAEPDFKIYAPGCLSRQEAYVYVVRCRGFEIRAFYNNAFILAERPEALEKALSAKVTEGSVERRLGDLVQQPEFVDITVEFTSSEDEHFVRLLHAVGLVPGPSDCSMTKRGVECRAYAGDACGAVVIQLTSFRSARRVKFLGELGKLVLEWISAKRQ